MFKNNLTKKGYIEIINNHLAPFMVNFSGGNNRLLQDNSPTHHAYAELNMNQIRWVRCITV